jgi:hypothetical protein
MVEYHMMPKMSIKLLLLKSGETLIAEAKEAVSEGKTQAYVLNNPFLVSVTEPYLLTEDSQPAENSVNVMLSPWIMFTSEKDIAVIPDWVVTIVEPVEGLREMYEEKVK